MNERFSLPWSLQGKYVLITGATDGIGKAAALALGARGAKLGLVARSQAKADEVARRITEAGGTADVFLAELSSQRSIRRVAGEILARCPRIDVLVNNAGAIFPSMQKTEDGVEQNWAVNHLAPFLLTTLLLERLQQSGAARVITTSSHGHAMARKGLDFDDPNGERLFTFLGKLTGGASVRYGQTKLANILFTAELRDRLSGSGVTAWCFDPGLVTTNFNQNNGWLASATMAVMRLFSRSAERGAQTLVWLAEAPELPLQAQGYFVDQQPRSPSAAAQDKTSALRLWELSESQVAASRVDV